MSERLRPARAAARAMRDSTRSRLSFNTDDAQPMILWLIKPMTNPQHTSRRNFARQVSLAAGAAAAAIAGPPQLSAGTSDPVVRTPPNLSNDRMAQAYELRVSEAFSDAKMGPAVNTNNGDTDLYPDKGGTYTKGLPHDAYGRVDPNAFAAFTTALKTGKASDFEKITIGGTHKLNGPQGGLCFDLDMMDSVQFGQPVVPPAPASASDQTATELLEHYWGSLLRDVNFGDYGFNPLAIQAAAELGAQLPIPGLAASPGKSRPNCCSEAPFPAKPSVRIYRNSSSSPLPSVPCPSANCNEPIFPASITAPTSHSWIDIQNGVDTGLRNQLDPQLRYIRNGRDLSALTHSDVLFQEYFIAYLVLSGINAKPPGGFSSGGAPLNPGNPYLASANQNGFGTFGGPDISASIEEVAVKALNAVWYQKWYVHLRPRPEAIGGIAHLLKTGQADKTDVNSAMYS